MPKLNVKQLIVDNQVKLWNAHKAGKILVRCDLDGCFCTNNSIHDYYNPPPHKEYIEKINRMYDAGNFFITIYTARYMSREELNVLKAYKRGYQEAYDWLKVNGVKFHTLELGKTLYDIWLDDKALPARMDNGMGDWWGEILPGITELCHRMGVENPFEDELMVDYWETVFVEADAADDEKNKEKALEMLKALHVDTRYLGIKP